MSESGGGEKGSNQHPQLQVLCNKARGRASTGQQRPLEGGTAVPVPAGPPATREKVNTDRRKLPDGGGRQTRTRSNNSVVSEIKHHPACIYIRILILIICLHLDVKIPEAPRRPGRPPGRSCSHRPVTSAGCALLLRKATSPNR